MGAEPPGSAAGTSLRLCGHPLGLWQILGHGFGPSRWVGSVNSLGFGIFGSILLLLFLKF